MYDVPRILTLPKTTPEVHLFSTVKWKYEATGLGPGRAAAHGAACTAAAEAGDLSRFEAFQTFSGEGGDKNISTKDVYPFFETMCHTFSIF